MTSSAEDVALPTLRSSHPHAEIISIQTQGAALPGVHLVSPAGLPGQLRHLPVSQDEYPLANGKVRYEGDPVAAVVAIDEQTFRRRWT